MNYNLDVEEISDHYYELPRGPSKLVNSKQRWASKKISRATCTPDSKITAICSQLLLL
jgi:hypothetical protein